MTKIVCFGSAQISPTSCKLEAQFQKSKRRKIKLNFSWLFTGRVVPDINTVEWKG